jgi:large subunit ribosomal protein L35
MADIRAGGADIRQVKHGVAGKRHRLISHNAKYIRQNRGTEVLAKADTGRVKLWAPYGLN